jgi:DNA-binding transcriptional MerR regulator
MKSIERKTYSIGEAARICGVTEKQIRHWEERELIPSPQRVICGKRSYRQFTEEGFNLIRRIREYLDEGYTLSVAAKKAQAEIGSEPEETGNVK